MTAEMPENSDQSGARRTDRPSLEVNDVTVSFGGVRALDEVSLQVGAGEVCGLIGPNGAGKTTLFDVVSGVRVPDRGTVHMDGDDVTSKTAVWRARAGLRRTFQSVQVFSWLSVMDNVVAAMDWEGGGGGFLADIVGAPGRRRRTQRRRLRARETLEQCGLTALADEPAGSLPIGLARMVELARATVDPPKVLLLDEPTSGLDDAETDRLAHQVHRIATEQRTAVLLVEHDMGFTMKHCDRLVALDLGRVIAAGSPEQIRADEQVRTAYLGTG